MNATKKALVVGLAVVSVAVAALAATNRVVQRIYISQGTLAGAFFPAFTYTAVDSPQTVTCPGTSGTCTIQADHWVEMKGSNATNQAWVCLSVDGTLDNFCGYYDDKIPPDGSWVQATSSHNVSGVHVGTHTVQTFANSGGGVNVAYFNINYRVYKP